MSYSSVVLADSPIRYYRLGEASGTVAHDLGSQGQNGTITGGVTLSQPGLLLGDADTAMLFDGNSGYISLPTTGLPTGASAWSMEARAKMPTLPISGNSRTVVGFGAFATNQNAQIEYDYLNDRFLLTIYGADIYETASSVVGGGTYHLVATYDGTTLTFYVNGGSVGTSTVTLALSLSFAYIGVGDNHFSGLIDEVAFYPTALSANQVKAHYLAGLYSLIAPLRDRFSIHSPLSSAARSRFFVQLHGLLAPVRDRFITAKVLKDLTRALFRTGKHRALKAAQRSEIQHINPILRSEVQHLNARFSGGPMSNPNTTIDVSVTVTDQNNFAVSNLTSCTCTITHSDGSTTGPLTSTNLGNGVYTVTYTTKNQGLTRELWSLTDPSGATAQFLNINPVSY